MTAVGLALAGLFSSCGFNPPSPADVIMRFEATNKGCSLEQLGTGSLTNYTYLVARETDDSVFGCGFVGGTPGPALMIPWTAETKDELLAGAKKGDPPHGDLLFKNLTADEALGSCRVRGFIEVEDALVIGPACDEASITGIRGLAERLALALR